MKLGETSNQRKAKFGVPRNAHVESGRGMMVRGMKFTDHYFSDKSEVLRPPPICVYLRSSAVEKNSVFVSFCSTSENNLRVPLFE
jgi:hypothetical protein